MRSEEYYRVVSDTPAEGFTAEERYKVVSDTSAEGFTAEERYKITEGPAKSDSREELDNPPEVEGTSRVREKEVERKVLSYFSEPIFSDRTLSTGREVFLALVALEADVVLFSHRESPIAIAECKGTNGANYGHRQLWSYLCASNTRFGIFANSLNCDEWVFYENLRHYRFRKIKRDEFEREVAAGNYSIDAKRSWTGDIAEDLNVERSDSEGLSEDSEYNFLPQENEIESEARSEIEDYLSEFTSQGWECSQKEDYKIQVGTKSRTADFVLRGRDDSFIIIADCTFNEEVNGSILYTLLRVTDAQFGIIAHTPSRDNWKFYENLRGSISALGRSAFEKKVNAQAKEAACPVFKGETISQQKWNEYKETWTNLKSDEKTWRVTEVFHPDCPFEVGKLLSDSEYEQARKDYPGCPVKKDEILTKAEGEQFKEAWPDVCMKSGSWMSDAEHQQGQEEQRVLKKKSDSSRSKLKLWPFIAAGVGLLLACFVGFFLTRGPESPVQGNPEQAVKIRELEKQISELKKQISGLQYQGAKNGENPKSQSPSTEPDAKIRQLEGKISRQEEKTGKLEKENREQAAEIRQLKKNISEWQRLLAEKDVKIEELEGKISGQADRIQELEEIIKRNGNGEDPPEDPPPPPGDPPPPDEIIVWVTRRGTKYHEEDCSTIARSSSKRPIPLAEAKQDKKEPCSTCDPPE